MCSCPFKVRTHVNVSKFHILIVRSAEHVAKYLPTESKASPLTVFECAFACFSLENSSHSQTIIHASSEPETRTL